MTDDDTAGQHPLSSPDGGLDPGPGHIHGRDGGDDLVDFGPALRLLLAGDVHALDALPPRERTLAAHLAPVLQAARREPDRVGDQTLAPTLPTQTNPPDTTRLDPSFDGREDVRARTPDPIALALGLIAGPDDVLEATRFKQARLRSGLNIKDIAEQLSVRGWHIEVKQVLRWQQNDTELVPALIQAISETLGTDPAGLRRRAIAVPSDSVETYLDDTVIAEFLADWARQLGVDDQSVRTRARQTLASMNYRNQARASRDDVLAVLRALRRLETPEPT